MLCFSVLYPSVAPAIPVFGWQDSNKNKKLIVCTPAVLTPGNDRSFSNTQTFIPPMAYPFSDFERLGARRLFNWWKRLLLTARLLLAYLTIAFGLPISTRKGTTFHKACSWGTVAYLTFGTNFSPSTSSWFAVLHFICFGSVGVECFSFYHTPWLFGWLVSLLHLFYILLSSLVLLIFTFVFAFLGLWFFWTEGRSGRIQPKELLEEKRGSNHAHQARHCLYWALLEPGT